MLRTLFVAALICACGGSSKPNTSTATSAPAIDKLLVLVDDQGVGLGGNDPVAYTTGEVTEGVADHTSEHGGATYRFATPENKATFDGAKDKYAPAFGGYCAFAASQNRLSESDPAVYLIHDGQLLMFTSADFLEQFKQDPAGNKRAADANWPGLVAQHGKPKT